MPTNEHAASHVVEAQYLAFNAADMAAFDALPKSVRDAMNRSLCTPTAQEMSHWIRLFGVRGALEMLDLGCRAAHNEAASNGEVYQLRNSDSLSLQPTNETIRDRARS